MFQTFSQSIEQQKAAAQKIVKVGTTVPMDLLFNGGLCGHEILLPQGCQVTFMAKGWSPYRIIEQQMADTIILWDLPGSRYVQWINPTTGDEETIASYTVDDED